MQRTGRVEALRRRLIRIGAKWLAARASAIEIDGTPTLADEAFVHELIARGGSYANLRRKD
jgi:hypothetical protein